MSVLFQQETSGWTGSTSFRPDIILAGIGERVLTSCGSTVNRFALCRILKCSAAFAALLTVTAEDGSQLPTRRYVCCDAVGADESGVSKCCFTLRQAAY